MTMRYLIKLILLLQLLHIANPAIAGDDFINPESFISGCIKGIVEKEINEYRKITGFPSDSISATLKAKFEKAAEPLKGSCACLARKISTKIESDTETNSGRKIEIHVDLSSLSNSAECAPELATSIAVRRDFMRVIDGSPPAISSVKTKRSYFSVDVTLSKARPSLFAAYTRPPESLTRLVFLAPGTGMACNPRDLCVDKSPLEITKATDFLASHERSLGKEGSRNLEKVIAQFGEDSRIITSSNNFTNFVPIQQKGGFTYPIQFIDGIPIEKTTVKKIWLVFFASQVPADPRATNFSPAIASVVEAEFLD